MCLKSSRSYSEDQMTRLARLMVSGKHPDRVGAVLRSMVSLNWRLLDWFVF